MTSAIARWHSNARPPSDALEQAYADQLEAEMQEMAIQLHKVNMKHCKCEICDLGCSHLGENLLHMFFSPSQRCEEVESLQSQVSQEKELRTVMEGCLMEDKMAWKKVHAELVENHRLAQNMSAMLGKERACRGELISCLTTDGISSSATAGEGTGVKGEFRWTVLIFGFTNGDFLNLFFVAGEGATRSSIQELMKKMDLYEEELGKKV